MKLAIYFFLILAYSSCTRKEQLDETALYNFIRDEDNGLIKIKDTEGFHLAMVWRPTDLIARQQAIKGTKKEFDSLNNYFSKYLYFTLEMTKGNKDLETLYAADPGSFADKISFLSSGLSQSIHLVTKKDTASVLDCIYSRSYGMSVSSCLIIVNKPKENHFEIEVNGYPLGFGKEVFPFTLSYIEKAPKLKVKFL
jgi:hypothetical protein